jgi:polysaccharide deacetylase family protein (PEP-CTERM system associated)
MKRQIANILTIDVEDYFQVEGFDRIISEADWDRFEIRFDRSLEWLLQILDSARVKATFFVLGWIVERHPHWIKEINRKGHEIAVHGYTHRRADTLTPEVFRTDLLRVKELLSNLGITEVSGYRAPSFSLTASSLWVWDILKECGFTYDASLSVKHFAAGGTPWARSDPGPQECQTAAGEVLTVFPQAYWPWKPPLPFAGGGYFRLYPYWVTRRGIAAWNRRGVPVTVYVHPWEFDPDQPRIRGAGPVRQFKHYVNLDIHREKFARLLLEFSFLSCREYLRARS